MARKFDLISELYERTCFAVTDNPVNWQSFLKTAGRNFRLRFDEQLLIYAQRPDATAVLEIERWNGTFGRWVNRGAKGIAVFEDTDRSRQRLIHYFDISDTHESRHSRPVPIWEMRPEYEAEVIETLENTFGAVNDTTSIENVVKESIANAVEDNIADYISDFMSLGAGSDIEYLSADEANALYLELVRNSVSYMVTDVVFDYLFGRGIDYEIINYCLEQKLIIESLPYHNAVFIGYDENKEPKYAAYRATNQSRIMGDCTGSKKQYSFRLTAENTGEVHLFECAIDLLSYATLMKLEGKDWRQLNLVSLAGVYSPKQKIEDSKVPVTLGRLLEKDKTIRRIVLHLDNDIAGRKATKALQTILSDKYEVVDDPPQYGKDVNDFLCKRLGIKDKTERSFAR